MIALRLCSARRLAHWSRAVWLALLVCVLVSAPAAASGPAARPGLPGAAAFRQAGEPPAFAPGEVLIGWEPGQGPVPAPPEALRNPAGRPVRSRPLARADAGWQAAAAALSAQTGSQVLDVQPAFGYARLAAPAGGEGAEMARLARLPWVRYAEPNYLIHAAAAVDPNDPYYSQQWNLPRVFAPQAWNITLGLSLVTVAVLDSGVDFGHPDLAGRLRSDGTNYITPGTPPQDDNGHGTHVAGIIAADTNNGIGVAGVAGRVMILPYKILAPDRHGGLTGTAEAMATAIYTAVSENAQVINISAGGTGDSTAVHNAVRNARLADVLVVAAAGNDGNTGNPLFYPAAYPEALAVAATDANDAHADYSGRQPYVALSAPGGT
ncbi:MAG TPA: S8 family serine peptidase, partial [Anaerolineae bacterium]